MDHAQLTVTTEDISFIKNDKITAIEKRNTVAN